MPVWTKIAHIYLLGLTLATHALAQESVRLPSDVKAPLRFRDINGDEHTLPCKDSARCSVLVFVNTECPIANAYQPTLRRLRDEFADSKFDFLMIHADAELTVEAARKHQQEYNIDWPVVLDPGNAIVRWAVAKVTPEAVVVDPRGKVLYRGRIDDRYQALGRKRAAPTSHDLQLALSAISQGLPVATPETKAVGCILHLADRINVLLIMADDLRDYGGAFAKDIVKTPNLDRLRARGTTFERAYVQYPVCNPSRSSLLVGLRPEQTGIVGNDTRLRQKMPDIITMPQLCKDAGWQSHAFGKIFHLGGGKDREARQAWMDAGRSWHTAQAFEATQVGRRMLEGRNVTGGALNWCQWGAADGSDDDQPDGQIAAATVAMIEKLGDAPWFIGCGFMKPHDPFIAPKKYFDMYPQDSLKPWHDPAGIIPVRKDAVGFGAYGEAFAKFTDLEWSELLRAYCAGTSFMDAQLGRVLDALDKHKLWDQTLVIFVGDHGYHTGERTWWNKNTLFERSCRAPLVIAAPDMQGGQTSRALVEFIDLYPTVADFCGLNIPHEVTGLSLRPVLKTPDASVKEAAFTLVTRSPKLYGQSIRTARWRFTLWSDDQTELYDHDRDPEELHNVASKHPDIVSELSEQLRTIGRPH